MCFAEFSILELEKRLEGIELLEAKIEFISDEVLICEKVMQELQSDMKLINPVEIRFYDFSLVNTSLKYSLSASRSFIICFSSFISLLLQITL